jgi:L-methionine (R)-S-oxide reductase
MSIEIRDAAYRKAHQQAAALLAGLNDPIAAMASVAALLFDSIPAASWVGFYRVVDTELLRVGPYQGPVGCLEIPFGNGVCGAVARSGEPLIVPDVHAFPGHIACDAQAQSEIVVPVTDLSGTLVAVLDVDSHEPANFVDRDLEHLQKIVALLRPCFEDRKRVTTTGPAQTASPNRTAPDD